MGTDEPGRAVGLPRAQPIDRRRNDGWVWEWLSRIDGRLDAIERDQRDIGRFLFGGDPGDLGPKLERLVAPFEDAVNFLDKSPAGQAVLTRFIAAEKRLDKVDGEDGLEKWKNEVRGGFAVFRGLAVVAAIMGSLSTLILAALTVSGHIR